MKGFYFSLDALLASSVLLALVMTLMAYPVADTSDQENIDLDLIDVAALQPVKHWNSTFNSSTSVIGFIAEEYYAGNTGQAEIICKNYFDVDNEYALYIGNSTKQYKVCGNYSLSENDNLETKGVVTPVIKSGNDLIKPKKALMVVQD